MPRRWSPEEEAWLAEHYGADGAARCAAGLARLVGREATVQAVYVKANKMGLHADPAPATPSTCRTVRWCEEPAMQAWMEANECGQPAAVLSAAFAAEFGFPLSRSQVSLWRSSNGRQTRRSRGGRGAGRPVGTERKRNGYWEVKVRERADVAQSKDNWVPKHILVYEEAHGPVPEGCAVRFADGDADNLDPRNLVAVPKRLAARLAARSGDWHDRDTLLAVAASEMLAAAILDADQRAERTCAVCGEPFRPRASQRYRAVRTCPRCVEAGRKAPGKPADGPPDAVCEVCGAPFRRLRKTQRRCPACIAASPKATVETQKRKESE